MFYTIYKITNKINGKIYVGKHQTKDLNDGYMGSGKAIKFSIKRYGKENHRVEILEMLENKELLAERERAIVTLSKVNSGKCMNLKVGGIGGFTRKPKIKKKVKKKPIVKKKLIKLKTKPKK